MYVDSVSVVEESSRWFQGGQSECSDPFLILAGIASGRRTWQQAEMYVGLSIYLRNPEEEWTHLEERLSKDNS
ncbi:MAG: hypothetical protein JWL61_3927 [Gemmatimonadetes bacterium]|nr:hypothetical protein [Gemmatimonadota bacterium]